MYIHGLDGTGVLCLGAGIWTDLRGSTLGIYYASAAVEGAERERETERDGWWTIRIGICGDDLYTSLAYLKRIST